MEMKESPLSQVLVPMPQITTTIGDRVSQSQFLACIKDVVNLLVGKYNVAEHTAYQELRHGRLNHIFMLARILCLPRPEPVVLKRKLAAASAAPAPRKTYGKCGRGRKSNRSEAQTSARKLALAQPVKPSKKFVAASSGLDPVVGVGALGKKMSSTSAGGSCMTHGAKRAMKLFDSESLASDAEATLMEWPWKRPSGSSVPKDAPKSSSAKGICRHFFNKL
jgi:hypothetical protein